MNMNQRIITSISIFTLSAAALVGCRESHGSTPAPASNAIASVVAAAAPVPAEERTKQELLTLGEHLVNTSGCHDCHTPMKMGSNGPEPDMSRMLSGHPAAMKLPPPPAPSGPWLVSIAATNTAYSGPWGISYTANLTPDMETGLGSWSRDTFIQTIRSGRHLGRGRPILPPMPIPVYRNFSDDELGAIFAYLQTIKPLENKVPEPTPPAATKSRG
jgi:mono/diheme cytochrome c family protein